MSGKFPGGFVTAGAPAGFSVAFNGASYLLPASNAAFNFGTGDFTVEAWVYQTASATSCVYDSRSTDASSTGFFFGTISTNFAIFTNNATAISTAITLNTWTHFALVRSGSTWTLYKNGVSSGTYSSAANLTDANRQIGASTTVTSSSTNYFSGYISNLRVVKGTALYTAAFTPPTQLFAVTNTSLLTCQSPTIIDNSSNSFTITPTGTPIVSTFTPFVGYTAGASGFNPALGAAAPGIWTLDEATNYQGNRLWPIYDPFFNRTTLMLHGNGTNAAQNNTFLDSSTNNFTITRNGNTTQGSFSPFSQTGWSNYFNGTTDFLSLTTTSALTLGTNSFTIEYFYYVPDTVGGQGRISWGAAGSPNIYLGTGALVTYTNFATSVLLTSSIPCTVNAWNHIAVVRNSGTATIYINGVSGGSVANTTNWTIGSGTFRIMSSQGTDYSSGYVSNLRIVNGTAVYTSNFTPPTSPLTAITNTVLLTCQNNRFVDNSANNYTITANGTPSVQAFSPFVPAYTTPTTYSNWFNGSSGYLSIADNAAFTLGTNNFTIEAWVYPVSAFANYTTIIAQSNNGTASSQAFDILVTSTGAILVEVYIGSTAYTITSSTTLSLNAWAHVALVRSGSTFTLYINGISVGTLTNAGSVNDSAVALTIGAETTPFRYWNGCISNVRIVNGTAVYTAAFTPPTAPLTNITNTSLLTCQSSTFIDNSTNNFTITATGSVQPVTSPTPFPAKVDTTTLNSVYSTSLIGGSGYFDGTGDYLTAPSNAAFNFGTGDFTIEGWMYLTSASGNYQNIFAFTHSGGTVVVRFGNSGAYNALFQVSIVATAASNVWSTSYSQSALVNQWVHFAFTRSGTTARVFINGVLQNIASGLNPVSFTVNSFTDSTNIASASTVYIGSDTISPFNGYTSGLRVLKGTAQYTSSFAPPTAPLTAITNTSLLLNFTNAGIIDNTAKNVLETVGTAQISTTQSKWGGSSMYFPGSSSYTIMKDTPNLTFGTGDFTLEFWVYNTVSGSDIVLFDGRPTTTNGVYVTLSYVGSSGYIAFYTNTAYQITGTTVLPLNTWTHIALCKASNQTRLFMNGLQTGSTYSDSNNYILGSNRPTIAGNGYTLGGAVLTGYIDDFRITKGVARYLSNFTPPTSQLQDQ